MLGQNSDHDWTERMEAYAIRRVARLATLDLRDSVKSRSPSCGMERVNLYANADPKSRTQPTKTGVGLFAAELLRALPDLPLEEEGRAASRPPPARELHRARVRLSTGCCNLWDIAVDDP